MTGLRFYGAIALLVLIAGMGVTIFVQSYMVETAETRAKVAEGLADRWLDKARERQRKINELTASLKEREHELERSQLTSARYRRRADALAAGDCLDRDVSADLDRLLRDAFPAREAGEAGQPGADAAPSPGVER